MCASPYADKTIPHNAKEILSAVLVYTFDALWMLWAKDEKPIS